MTKKGNAIKPKTKVIITKGPLERLILDRWELDEKLKVITGFNRVIDLIDHFQSLLCLFLLKMIMPKIYYFV